MLTLANKIRVLLEEWNAPSSILRYPDTKQQQEKTNKAHIFALSFYLTILVGVSGASLHVKFSCLEWERINPLSQQKQGIHSKVMASGYLGIQQQQILGVSALGLHLGLLGVPNPSNGWKPGRNESQPWRKKHPGPHVYNFPRYVNCLRF